MTCGVVLYDMLWCGVVWCGVMCGCQHDHRVATIVVRSLYLYGSICHLVRVVPERYKYLSYVM